MSYDNNIGVISFENMKRMDINVPYLVLNYEKLESSMTCVIFKLNKPL